MRRISGLLYVVLITLFVGCSPPEDVPKEEKWDVRRQSREIRAPDFILNDLQGQNIKLSDYSGRDVLLVFGATWCRFCRTDIPRLKEMYSRFKEKGFEIINIYTKESQKKVAAFVERHEISYKVLLDKKGIVARQYGIRGVPTHCLVSRDGMILCFPCRRAEVLLSMMFDGETMK